MAKFFNTLKSWLGYSRQERRASIVLLIIVVMLGLAKQFVTSKEASIEISEITMVVDTLFRDSLSVGESVHREALYGMITRGDRSYSGQDLALEEGVGRQRPRHSMVELNACDSAMLESLPGIGPVLSARIIKYRRLLGGFYSVEQLREVYGLSDEHYRAVTPWLSVDTLLIEKIEINGADYATLIKMPYLSKEEVRSILKYKEVMGVIGGFNELVENGIITHECAEKTSAYFLFSTDEKNE